MREARRIADRKDHVSAEASKIILAALTHAEARLGELEHDKQAALGAWSAAEARVAVLNSESADLNRENTKLLEKWSEAKARDPQQGEYLTSLADAEARVVELSSWIDEYERWASSMPDAGLTSADPRYWWYMRRPQYPNFHAAVEDES